MIGHPPCYANLVSTCLWLWESTNSAITGHNQRTDLVVIRLNPRRSSARKIQRLIVVASLTEARGA
jgi:hypothetical protein